MSEIKNAIITSVELGIDEPGTLGAWLHLDYGNCAQGFGGYALYLPDYFKHHAITSHAGHFIFRCLEVAGVTKWQDLVGKSIRAECDHSHVRRIGHITKDIWFDPKAEFSAGATDE